MSETLILGGCLCGDIRYEASGTPFDITHCHCADCRRSSGAPFVTWASFQRSNLRFTAGNPREIHFAGRFREFCRNCGTPLTFMASPDAGVIDVTVCSFDDPTSVTPADHTWIEDRLPWIKSADGLPEFPRNRADS